MILQRLKNHCYATICANQCRSSSAAPTCQAAPGAFFGGSHERLLPVFVTANRKWTGCVIHRPAEHALDRSSARCRMCEVFGVCVPSDSSCPELSAISKNMFIMKTWQVVVDRHLLFLEPRWYPPPLARLLESHDLGFKQREKHDTLLVLDSS